MGNVHPVSFAKKGDCFLLFDMLLKKAYLEFMALGAGFSRVRFPSGQREQTVNLPA
jgi:hypothetical protein